MHGVMTSEVTANSLIGLPETPSQQLVHSTAHLIPVSPYTIPSVPSNFLLPISLLLFSRARYYLLILLSILLNIFLLITFAVPEGRINKA